jgi:hypothetical protein
MQEEEEEMSTSIVVDHSPIVIPKLLLGRPEKNTTVATNTIINTIITANHNLDCLSCHCCGENDICVHKSLPKESTERVRSNSISQMNKRSQKSTKTKDESDYISKSPTSSSQRLAQLNRTNLSREEYSRLHSPRRMPKTAEDRYNELAQKQDLYINSVHATLQRLKLENEQLARENDSLKKSVRSVEQIRRPLKQCGDGGGSGGGGGGGSVPSTNYTKKTLIRRNSSSVSLTIYEQEQRQKEEGVKEEGLPSQRELRERATTFSNHLPTSSSTPSTPPSHRVRRERAMNVESKTWEQDRPIIIRQRAPSDIVIRRDSGASIRRKPRQEIKEEKRDRETDREMKEYEEMKANYARELLNRQASKRNLLEKRATRRELLKPTVESQKEIGIEGGEEEEYEVMLAEYKKFHHMKPEDKLPDKVVAVENFTPYKNGVLNHRISGEPIDSLFCLICQNIDKSVIKVKILTDRRDFDRIGKNIAVYREINICNACQIKRNLNSSHMILPEHTLQFFKPLEANPL